MTETQPETEISCLPAPGSCGEGAPAGQRVLIQGAKVLLASRQSPSSPVDLEHSRTGLCAFACLPSPRGSFLLSAIQLKPIGQALRSLEKLKNRARPTRLQGGGQHSASLQALSRVCRRLTPHTCPLLPHADAVNETLPMFR